MIAAVVVLYNPSIEEIENIRNFYKKVDKTIIMDNSCYSQYEKVRDIFGDTGSILYKHYGKNVGLCKALNEGIKLVRQYGCKWALVMDQDSSFITDLIAVYKKYLKENKNQDIAILAPVHIHDRNYEHKCKSERLLRWAMTSGCLFNTDIFEKMGGFKEELFVDGLDIDYGYKVGKAGYKIIEIGDAKLKHHPGETRQLQILRKKINYGIASPWRYYMQARAIIWLILKYHYINDVARYFMKWGKVIGLFDNKKKYIYEMIRGTKDGIELWKKDKMRK